MRGIARRYKNLVSKISRAEMNATFIEYEMFQLLKLMEDALHQSAGEFGGSAIESSAQDAPAKINKSLRYLADAPEAVNPGVIERLASLHVPVVSLSEVPRSLEDVYLQVVEAPAEPAA